MALLGTDPDAVLAAVDECVGLLHGGPVRVVPVHGLPGVPLTLPHMVEEIGAGQLGGPAADADVSADADEQIVRILARRSGEEAQVLLIIEQADLLPLQTLAFLQVASIVFGARTPRLQLLFAGHPRFLQRVDRDELRHLHERLEAVIRLRPSRAGPASSLAAPGSVTAGGGRARARAVPRSNRPRMVLVAVLALMAVTAAATLAVLQYDAPPLIEETDDAAAPGAPQVDPPAAGTVEPQAMQPAQPPQQATRDAAPAPTAPPERRAPPSGEQLARLRGEFDRFLAQTEWGSKRMSEAERSRLFNEYLRWNYGAMAASPGPPP